MSKKPITSRRREVRKSMPRHRRSLREVIGRSQVIWGLVLLVLFIAVASWIGLEARSEPAYRPGQLVDRAQVARVSFQSLNLQATEQARENARAKVPGIYVPNESFLEGTRKKLETLPEVAAAAETLDDVNAEVRGEFGLTQAVLDELRKFQEEDEATGGWIDLVGRFMADLHSRAILTTDRYQAEKQNLAADIRLKRPDGSESRVYEADLVNTADGKQVARLIEQLASDFSPPVREALVTYFQRARKPTYEHDADATESARTAAAEAVEPELTDYEPDQTIVEAGERLDQDGYDLLRREQRAYIASLPAGLYTLYRVGPLVLIALVSLGLGGGAVAMRPRVAANPMRGLALAGLLLVTLVLAWWFSPFTTAAAAVAPAMLAAVILSIAYDQRFAIAVGVLHAVLIALVLNLSMGLYLVALVASVVAVLQLRDVRNRGALIRIGFITGVVVAVAIVAASFSERQLVEGIYWAIGTDAGVGFGSALAVGFFVLGVLPFIERAFKVTTAMSLLELCDVNQPLLRRLAQHAPGTYNHSLQVGTLAEAASEAIGADGLLARVGAYYHDIGKINKPHYFVENQAGTSNPHEKVSPAMSLLIIVGHVKDGVEMAREYGLPPAVIQFIESHHGTTLVEYFYNEAKKRKGQEDQPEEVEYRYPGPKPQTRETAILMLCDAVESASRTLAEPTSTRIEQLVHKLATKRLTDGQFDHCHINFAELQQIEEAITKTLTAIYHGRVAYPTGRQDPKQGSGGEDQKKKREAG